MISGFLFILGNILIASLQSVFLSHWLKGVNLYFVVATSFTIVMTLYICLTLGFGRPHWSTLLHMKRQILLLNLVSAGNWIFYFLAIRFLNPAAVVTLTQCLPPVLITAYSLVARKAVLRSTVVFHLLILACVIMLLTNIVEAPPGHDEDAMLGGAVSILCAITVSMTIGVSKQFANKGLPGFVVLSTRFPLLVVLAWIMTPPAVVATATPVMLLIIATIAIVGLAMANFCLQKGIELSNPMVVSTTLSISPFVVLVFDRISNHDATVNTQALLIATIVVLSLGCIYANYRHARLRAPVAVGSTAKNGS
ncbi:MAG: hypothetical protein V4793_13695 [Paraburkholderia tropica]|uniref:hypothetical protein n=1 Tax=Burkholderia gladioli TaxID=28095 RepID=UPI000F0B5BC3|nr:hypothetical protein [Burkholderia gladioli]AYQ91519.1 hypothetical protein EDD84_29975 [Burkholderia gladioli]